MTASAPQADRWIVLNGERRPLPAGASLVDVLDALHLGLGDAVAVAVNDRMVRRGEWSALRLAHGDRVEVVRPMQGG